MSSSVVIAKLTEICKNILHHAVLFCACSGFQDLSVTGALVGRAGVAVGESSRRKLSKRLAARGPRSATRAGTRSAAGGVRPGRRARALQQGKGCAKSDRSRGQGRADRKFLNG